MIKLAIVIPTLNEAENIKIIVDAFLKNYSKQILEIIIVDDASKDKTGKIADDLVKKNNKVKVIHRKPPYGVGLSIKEGVRRVNPQATHILTIDADYVINIPYIKSFFKEINKYDGLVGSRYIVPGSIERYSIAKKIANRSFHLLCRIILGIKQKDLTNNFKFYKKEIFDNIPLTAWGFSVNAETGIYPLIYGYKIGEIPVKYPGRTADMGVSKFKLLNVGPNYLRVLGIAWLLKSGVKK